MKKIWIVLMTVLLISVQWAWAEHPSKDIGKDYPDAILLSDPTVIGNAFQVIQGDIDGNDLTDLICTGSKGDRRRYVSVFFDATLSSLNGKIFQIQILRLLLKRNIPGKPM